jgi:hypothetical protein
MKLKHMRRSTHLGPHAPPPQPPPPPPGAASGALWQPARTRGGRVRRRAGAARARRRRLVQPGVRAGRGACAVHLGRRPHAPRPVSGEGSPWACRCASACTTRPHARPNQCRRAQSFPAHAGSCPPTASACGPELVNEHAACMQGGVAATRAEDVPPSRPPTPSRCPAAARRPCTAQAPPRARRSQPRPPPAAAPEHVNDFGSAVRSCMPRFWQNSVPLGRVRGCTAANSAEQASSQARCAPSMRPRHAHTAAQAKVELLHLNT